LPGAEDDGTEGTVGAVVLGAVVVGFGTVGTVGGVRVVEELCVGALDGLLGSVGLEGLFAGAGFEGFAGAGDECPWLPLFPGADGAVVLGWPVFGFGPFGPFGLFFGPCAFGPCAFGGRCACAACPCGLGFGVGTVGTVGFSGFEGFDGWGVGFDVDTP
jgi:hypothetical protein